MKGGDPEEKKEAGICKAIGGRNFKIKQKTKKEEGKMNKIANIINKILNVSVLFSLMLFAFNHASAKESIKIGMIADLSGDYSFYDGLVRDGAQFAFDKINKEGGILGQPIEFIVHDGRGDQSLSVRLTEEVIDKGVSYFIGTCSQPLVAMGRIACEAGVPISTGCSTAPVLVGQMGPCAFQWAMTDNVQGSAAAQWAYGHGYRTAYLLQSTEYPYTKDLPLYFGDAFEKLGGEVMGILEYRLFAGDYSAQVTKLASLSPKPDVIFTPMFLPDPPPFMRQLRAAGLDIPVIGGDGMYDNSILEVGKSMEGLVFVCHGFPAKGNPMDGLYNRYKGAKGEFPAGTIFGIGYDEGYIIKKAIEVAESPKPSKLLSTLPTIKGFKGVTGETNMNPQSRLAKRPGWVVEIKNGAFSFVDVVSPSYVPEIK